MGCGALVSHLWNNSPYDNSDLKYYISAPVISGPTQICLGSPKTFSASNWQSGYYWVASNLSLSSPTTNSTITVSPYANGVSWLSIRNSSGTELVRQNLIVGPPQFYNISGEFYPCTDYVGYYQMQFVPNTPAATSYEWRIEGDGDSYITSPWWGEYCSVAVGCLHPFKLYAKACNDCGCNEVYATIYPQMCRGSVSPAYPNPVSGILNVDVGSTANTQARTNLTYDVRLYNVLGNMVRQAGITGGGTVRLDVSNLPDGFYYLHIYDGVSQTPELQQIVVKH